mgnify:FL=1
MSRENRELNEAREEIARLKTELENAQQEFQRFTYSVSHDLRAPLRAIRGFSEDFPNQLGEEGKRYLNIIGASAVQMSKLLDAVLSYSRLGRQEIRLADLDMKELARGAFAELTPETKGRKIDFQVGDLPSCPGDTNLIGHLWAVLLSNALKFSAPRECSVIEIGGRAEGNEAVFWVKDNGVGFDVKYVGKLFGMFQRLHSDSEFEGVGAGLAIAQRIVRRHHGRIWAEADVDKGACFLFRLPLAK